MDQEESKMGTEHKMDQEEPIVDTEHNLDQEENKMGTDQNMDQEESKMGIEHNIDQEECRVGTEHNMDQEESKIGTVDSMDKDESKMGTEGKVDQEKSRVDTGHIMDQEESKIATVDNLDQDKSKMDTEDNMDQEKSRVDTGHIMDQEESKIATVDNLDQDKSKMGTEDNMDQEKSRVDSEHNMNQEESKMGAENLPDFSSSTNRQSPENDDSKKDTGPPEGSSKPDLSEKITPRSLKAKKIVKKSLVGVAKLKAKKNNNSTPQILRKKIKRKNKKVEDNAESSHKEDEKQISDSPQQNEPPKEENQDAGNNDVKESQNTIGNDQSPTKKSRQDKKDKEINPSVTTEQEQKSEEKHTESNKGSRRRKNKNKRKGKGKSSPNDKEKSLPNDKENSLSNGKKSEKLGGLIFMCSAKTKPDCFRYRVMGVSAAKKDDILRIKPGLKLFLYDFDLKLLYGIYKASSSGRMKLEPRAFGGKFPAQVRFNIVSDSFPLPESIFKKAIKDNYNKNKFKPELTVAQVRKLTRLFRPVGAHSAVQQPIYSPPKAIIREREVPDRVRESQHHSHRERAAGHRFERREDIPRDSFLMEKNYRAYDRRNVATTYVNPIMEPYEIDYEHRLVEPRYRSNVPAHVESLRRDPIYLNDREQQSYTRVFSDHINDPYAHRYGASSRDAYLAPLSRATPLSREDIAPSSYLAGGRPFSGTDNLRRREIVEDRHYSVYSAADALPDYRPIQPYCGDKLEDSPIRVSACYSFAGPSFSRR